MVFWRSRYAQRFAPRRGRNVLAVGSLAIGASLPKGLERRAVLRQLDEAVAGRRAAGPEEVRLLARGLERVLVPSGQIDVLPGPGLEMDHATSRVLDLEPDPALQAVVSLVEVGLVPVVGRVIRLLVAVPLAEVSRVVALLGEEDRGVDSRRERQPRHRVDLIRRDDARKPPRASGLRVILRHDDLSGS